MPILRDWMLHHPNVWTPQQVADYVVDTRKSLVIGIGPTAATVGVPAACGILLQVVTDMVQAQPVYAGAVLDQLVDIAGRIEALGSQEGVARQ